MKLYTLQTYQQEHTGINWNHYFSKAFDQLRGLCHGMLCDGEVSDKEAEFLRSWLKENSHVTHVWPFSDVAARVSAIFADGVISDEEREELKEIMETITSGNAIPTAGVKETAWEEVFTKPEPELITFPGNRFSMTGKFAFGSRSKVVKQIESLGGAFDSNPIIGTHFLIIGEFGSPDWKNSNYGNKIEKAVNMTRDGKWNCAIVREALFKSSLL